MNSSNELLAELARTPRSARNPGFAVIVAFDFYDGPESGLALFPSGEGVRFESLGDSAYRMFRAFELVPILGDWRARVENIRMTNGTDREEGFMFAPANDRGERLEQDVNTAESTGQFVCVGDPYLDKLRVTAVTSAQLTALRRLNGSPEAFRLTHALVKGKNDLQMAAE